ncbi:MAG TPA: acyl-CoA dehydrogenase [Chloroflexota bacterium]|nr:acyl-CoA dehydrogenase [Chloroflexota bacterium]
MSYYPLTDEERLILDTVRAFARERVAPRAAEIDRTAEFPWDLVREMSKMGLLGVCLPEEYGGAGQSYVLFAMIVEELCKACATTGLIMDVNISLCAEPIVLFGNEEQKKRFLTPLASGEKLGALAITEPEAGSDAAGIKTTAVRDGDQYVLNGTKVFTTNGGVADIYVCTAVTDPGAGHKGITDFVVEKGMPGLSFGEPLHKLGICGSATTEVHFDNVRVPIENRLGEEGMGFKITMDTLDGGRIGIAAQAVGIAQSALDDAVAYITQRKQFGQRIADFEAVQFMVADMATQIEAARLLTLQAAALREQKIPCARESSMAKLFAGDMAMRVTIDALQLFGGYGYIKEYPAERHMRDAKITQIYEGTQQIQRLVIARSIVGTRAET